MENFSNFDIKIEIFLLSKICVYEISDFIVGGSDFYETEDVSSRMEKFGFIEYSYILLKCRYDVYV